MKIKITSWISSFVVNDTLFSTPPAVHHISLTEQGHSFSAPKNRQFNRLLNKKVLFQHTLQFHTENGRVFGVKLTVFSCWTEGCVELRGSGCWNDDFLVLNWGMCLTEGVLNWRVFDVVLREVLNWGACLTDGCVELMGFLCWTDGFLLLNWGVCWTDGFWVLLAVCWNDVLKWGSLCGTEEYPFLWTDNLCFQDFLKYIIILLKSSN